MLDFRLPELGENVTTGDVLRVLVKEGDTVARDQPVLELETDKATIEVPSSVAGQVAAVNVKPGDKVKVGQSIFSVSDGGSEPARPAAAAPPVEAPAKGDAGPASGAAAETPAALRPAPEAPRTETRTADPVRFRPPAIPGADTKIVDISRGARAAATPGAEPPAAPAAPSVRRLARELGVDIDQVAGTGSQGRISVDDVKAHAKRLVSSAAQAGEARPSPSVGEPLPDFSRWGEIERQPMRAVRRKTAVHLSAAWSAIPHVTQHEVADVTALEELRKRYAPKAEAAGGALTVTAIAVKVVASALQVFPQFNASIDLEGDAIILKKYIHIGVAVDTDRGLLVPVIRDADTKNIIQLSIELAQLSEKARSRKLTLDEMQGGCFSISNLGGLGGTSFTPIVNLPEVAILGISRARLEPVYQKDTNAFVPKLMLPLSLSYDHRVIDGADGVRFLRWIVEALEQPFLLALHG
jgi:pyruvate dehydrogenase E2 component (dihydrolipoamide acetyltransferase)